MFRDFHQPWKVKLKLNLEGESLADIYLASLEIIYDTVPWGKKRPSFIHFYVRNGRKLLNKYFPCCSVLLHICIMLQIKIPYEKFFLEMSSLI